MGEIFGAVGSIASASIQAGAIKDATQMQIDALNRQREFVYSELEPGKISDLATAQDTQRAKDRLALQAIVDPTSLANRYSSQEAIARQLGILGQAPGEVGAVAAEEAIKGIPGMEEGKKRLVDAALQELSLGATLPPDVQAELVKAGLEQSGMTTGAASPKGFGGTILRQVLGTAGLALRQKRQEQAAGLLGQAQNLESERQRILGTLFPNLSAVQLNTLKGTQDVLAQSNQMVPEAGLGGTDIANLWLARVGATNQLAQSAADAAARGGMAQAQAWQQGLGAAIPYAANALPSTKSTWNWLSSGSQPSSMSAADQADVWSSLGV